MNKIAWRLIIFVSALSLLLLACNTPASDPETNPNFTARPEEFTYYAAGGIQFPVIADVIYIKALQAGFIAPTSNERNSQLAVTVEISNLGREEIDPQTIVLLDGHGGRYSVVPATDLAELAVSPITTPIGRGETAVGDLVFNVPTSALTDNLHLRLDSNANRARLEIFLGDVTQRRRL